MAATAALSAAAVGQVAAGKSGAFAALTVALAITTGVLALAAGLARLGFVANFISEPALKGFIVGLALTIIVGQVPKLLGVGKGSGDFFSQLWYLLAFGLPRVPAADYLNLTGPAVGIMLVGFAEGLGAAKTYAARNGYQISPDKELIGLGAANLAAGLSSGMVVNGSLSKTAVNGSAGARTQASGLVVAVLTVITLLFLTGLFEDLPEATLAAVVIAALIELVDIEALAALYRAYSSRLGQIYGLAARADFIAAVAAMLGVLIFDTLPGLIIGGGGLVAAAALPGLPAACRGAGRDPRQRRPVGRHRRPPRGPDRARSDRAAGRIGHVLRQRRSRARRHRGRRHR